MPLADTIGAGDTCTGVLPAAWAQGLPLAEAACHANAAAALSVTGRAAIDGMPGRAQGLHLLAGATR